MVNFWAVQVLYTNGYSKDIVCCSIYDADYQIKELRERKDVTYARLSTYNHKTKLFEKFNNGNRVLGVEHEQLEGKS